MRISVVLPVYNGERYLREAVGSVLAQTRPADEIIVYDDGSTDSSRELCAAFGDSVKLVRGLDGPSGFVNGWNKAIASATGDFIAILHQDDVLYPEFLEVAESTLKSNPDVRHLFAVCDYIDEHSRPVSVFPAQESLIRRYTGKDYVKAYQQEYGPFPHIHRCPGVMTHRSVFEHDQCRYTDKAGHIADDDFFYRVGQYTDVMGILRPLAAYRVHSASATGTLESMKLIRRLARDYQYQVNQWHHSSFLDSSDKYYFEYWALRYQFKSLVGALKNRDEALFRESAADISRLLALGLEHDHAASLRKIRFLLTAEKVVGFSILGRSVRWYA
ncbi:MAG: glycosyltransferase [Chlorobiaceae bacterium]|nr:glycosyltransferase [Chlorobiaceae bacterium]